MLRSTFGHVCKGNQQQSDHNCKLLTLRASVSFTFLLLLLLCAVFFTLITWCSGIQPSVSFVSSLEPGGESSTGNGGGRGGAALRISRPGLGDKGLSALCSSGHLPLPPHFPVFYRRVHQHAMHRQFGTHAVDRRRNSELNQSFLLVSHQLWHNR